MALQWDSGIGACFVDLSGQEQRRLMFAGMAKLVTRIVTATAHFFQTSFRCQRKLPDAGRGRGREGKGQEGRERAIRRTGGPTIETPILIVGVSSWSCTLEAEDTLGTGRVPDHARMVTLGGAAGRGPRIWELLCAHLGNVDEEQDCFRSTSVALLATLCHHARPPPHASPCALRAHAC